MSFSVIPWNFFWETIVINAVFTSVTVHFLLVHSVNTDIHTSSLVLTYVCNTISGLNMGYIKNFSIFFLRIYFIWLFLNKNRSRKICCFFDFLSKIHVRHVLGEYVQQNCFCVKVRNTSARGLSTLNEILGPARNIAIVSASERLSFCNIQHIVIAFCETTKVCNFIVHGTFPFHVWNK